MMSRYLNPQTSPEKAFSGSIHLLTRYLGDCGCLGSGRQTLFALKDYFGKKGGISRNLKTDTCIPKQDPLIGY